MTRIQVTKTTKVGTEKGATKPIRLQPATIAKLQNVALGLVGAAEIEQLRQGSMSNADRLEAAYHLYVAKQSGASKDEFLGLLLAGKVNIPCNIADAGDGRKDAHAAVAS